LPKIAVGVAEGLLAKGGFGWLSAKGFFATDYGDDGD
jgi:hypothetical protein